MVKKAVNQALVARIRPLLVDFEQKDRAARAMQSQAEAAMDRLRAALPDHDFTNVSCRKSPGYIGHIYPPSVYHGVGNRNCILCGEDDWSE